jgi:hypothetical protein
MGGKDEWGQLNETSGGRFGPSKIGVAINMQFQQAGLYQHLGKVFTDITAQLAAAEATPALLVKMQHSPAHKHVDQQQPLRGMLSAAQQGLMLYTLLQLLWPLDATLAAWDPAIDAAVVSLALTAAQQVSKWLDALPASSPEPYIKLQGLLQDAWTALTRCITRRIAEQAAVELSGAAAADEVPLYAQLQSSPQWLAAVCVLAFYATHAGSGEAEGRVSPAAGPDAGRAAPSCGSTANSSSKASSSKGRPGGSSKKGPGRSSNASSNQQQTGTAGSSSGQAGSQWARACSRAQQLPPIQQELLQVLECSGKVLLWVALAEPAPVGVHALMRMDPITIMRGVVEAHRGIVAGFDPTADDAQQQTGVLHTLLPGLSLPWVIAQPRTEQQFVDCCTLAGDLTTNACKAVYQRLYSTVTVHPGTVVVPGSAAEQVGWGLLDTKLLRILPDLMLALDPLLAKARSSSSSRSSSRRQGRPASEEDMTEALWFLVGCFSLPGEPAVRLQVVKPYTWYSQPAEEAYHTAGAGSTAFVQHPWQQHAAEVTALLDSYVRLPQANKATGACNISTREDHELRFAVLARMCAVGDRPQPAALTATAIAAGLGSTEQQRLFGLLCSMVKRSSMLGFTQQTDAEECRLVAAGVAARYAQLYASSSSAAAAADSATASSCVSGLLPWLVLFGRCCLQWSTQLQWWYRGLPGLPPAAAVAQSPLPPGYSMRRMGIGNCMDIFFRGVDNSRPGAQQPLVSMFLAALQTALQHPAISAQVTAAGLDADALLANVSFAKVAVDAARSDRLATVISAVKDLGQALTSLPCATACNNPLCTNLSDASEVQLVQGNQHKCSACRVARYCGKECQAQHWKQHKPVCKALAAAAAAAAAARIAELLK